MNTIYIAHLNQLTPKSIIIDALGSIYLSEYDNSKNSTIMTIEYSEPIKETF